MNMRNRWLERSRLNGVSAALVLLVAGATLARAADQPRQIFAREYFHTFAHNNPVLERIKPDEIIFTRTLDSGGQDEKNEHRSQPSNPLTGPFYVEGAEKGDAIAVHFRKVRLNRNWGYSVWRLALISLTPDSIETLYSDKYKPDLVRKGSQRLVPWDIDLAHGTLRLREPVSKRVPLEFPARPMLGCVGVAAPGEFAPTSGPAGSYGGNLDYNEIGEGHPGPWPPPIPDEVPDDSAAFEESDWFDVVAVRRYVWAIDYDADGYLALLNTFSGHIAMDPAKRAHLYDEIRRRLTARPSGTVHRHWVAVMTVGRRR